MSTSPRKADDVAEAADKLAGKIKSSEKAAEVREDVERTREQLGDTVEALAHKANVPERVKGKADETKQAVQAKAGEVRQQVQAKAKEVKQQVHEGTEVLQDKAEEVSEQARTLINEGMEKLPSPVAQRAEQVIEIARKRPVLATVAVLATLRLVRRLMRRRRDH